MICLNHNFHGEITMKTRVQQLVYLGSFKRILVLILAANLVGCVSTDDLKAQDIECHEVKTESINLIDCENPEAWEGKVLLNTEIKRSGEYSFETFGKYPTRTDYKHFIPIDPAKTYILSCYMRSLDPEQPASGYMGLYMYDENKRFITYSSVAVYAETESELVEPAVKGSTAIIIKKNEKCLSLKHWSVAFNAKAEYADLPNFDLSPKGKEIIVDNDQMKLVLSSPLTKNYDAGTKIRIHSPWRTPFYWAAQGWMPGEWQEFSVSLTGIAPYGVSKVKFWKGTKYVKPFIWFGNYNRIPKAGARLLVDDFTFTESK